MVFGSRLGMLGRRKPHLIFDKRWNLADDMKVGDRGQIIATVEATRIYVDRDMEGFEMKIVDLTIREAEKLVKFRKSFL